MPGSSVLRRLGRAVLPVGIRRFLGRAAHQAPGRLRDFPRDAVCLFSPRVFGGPVPPPGLRSRVGGVSRREFSLVGQTGAEAILAAFQRVRDTCRDYPAWLDFGCGCGRIARFLALSPAVRDLSGVDVDTALLDWTRRHIPGRFETMSPVPPLVFEAAAFDVVYAASIFTHYTEEEQRVWLAELLRILKPGGLLVATTLSPSQAGQFGSLGEAEVRALTDRGFLCLNPTGKFNERASFHSPEYLRKTWGPSITPCLYEPGGFVRYQNLSVWRKSAGPRR